MTVTRPRIDFIRQRVAEDLRDGGRVVTRFPPEPNGYLHIGHAKAICLDFGVAAEFGGRCHLRFDDTNPTKEEQEFVDAIRTDIRWLGFDWGEHEYYASDYFDTLYEYALRLIRKGRAYVDHLSPQEVRRYRGTLTEPGRESPYRDRPMQESLELFEKMRAGGFETGQAVLRARIDMASPNVNMRDPVLYRVLKASHHRTGDRWCIYPTYDFAHGQSDSIEGITHSLCTLEFEDHRPLYDWLIEQLEIHAPRQIEFARLNLSYTVMSKRKLALLVGEGHVRGWDDPRMPTLAGLRRRGVPPPAIRAFCELVGVTKYNSVTDIALLEHAIRDELNRTAPRAMAVLRPLRLVIVNWPAGRVEQVEALNNPEDPSMGTRTVPFSGTLYIERDDFREDPPPRYYRLAPGQEVRLRYGYLVRCVDVARDASGEVTEVRCTYDPASRGGSAPDGRRVRGTIHWVPADGAVEAQVHLYDRLFLREDPDQGDQWRLNINPASLEILRGCLVEPAAAGREPGWTCQFERLGYFCVDPDSTRELPVFNRTVPLRDTWAKIQGRQAAQVGRKP
jgi:glutaminyl-tRNA synthetase